MKSIEETQEEIVDEFNSVDDWMDRYTMIIDEGNTLPELPEKYRTPSNLIEGCQSRVWVNAELTPEGRIHFEADSDALIVKGIIALLVKVLDNRTPDEVINADLHFINDIGLGENLSPTRSNGLLAMIKQMRLYALAYKAKLSEK
ncbi:MAG: SufE family protein [Muribaculaceae bacterium]|nr:SufE family protein [Muribaculaceae bacterium]